MRERRIFRLTLILLTVCALTPLSLALAEEASPQSGANLLRNPGFEEGAVTHDTAATIKVANGWTPWWIVQAESQQAAGYGRQPTYFLDTKVAQGSFSQSWKHAFGTAPSGIYQQVSVPSNALLRLEAYGMGYSCNPPIIGTCPATSTVSGTVPLCRQSLPQPPDGHRTAHVTPVRDLSKFS